MSTKFAKMALGFGIVIAACVCGCTKVERKAPVDAPETMTVVDPSATQHVRIVGNWHGFNVYDFKLPVSMATAISRSRPPSTATSTTTNWSWPQRSNPSESTVSTPRA